MIISKSHNDGLLVFSSLCLCLVLKVLCRSCFAFVIRKENKAFPINMTCPAQSARAVGTRNWLFADPRGCPVSGGAERGCVRRRSQVPPPPASSRGPPASHSWSLIRSIGSDEDPTPQHPFTSTGRGNSRKGGCGLRERQLGRPSPGTWTPWGTSQVTRAGDSTHACAQCRPAPRGSPQDHPHRCQL